MLRVFQSLVVATFISVTYALISAVDSSQLVSEATYKKAFGEGFTKAIIRGYQEACGIGGQVDPNFVASYKNARAAGYRDIDMYWFPCNGATHNCKSYATQLSAIAATFKANSMDIGTIWIDIEKDSVCDNWDFGTAGNLAQAKDMIAAMKATGFKFGIYSTPGEWSSIFGSDSVVLDNSVPLWFATFDNVKTLTMGTKFGGWTSAVGHQYTDVSASGLFDLSVFAS
ncbi:glycoside hydrolase superfamily [Panaeolus papilionaceus]|nr:glycoside hydrolase superfamily [Panaeolus papilionaceus]